MSSKNFQLRGDDVGIKIATSYGGGGADGRPHIHISAAIVSLIMVSGVANIFQNKKWVGNYLPPLLVELDP